MKKIEFEQKSSHGPFIFYQTINEFILSKIRNNIYPGIYICFDTITRTRVYDKILITRRVGNYIYDSFYGFNKEYCFE